MSSHPPSSTEALPRPALWPSFFAAGFECSWFRRRSGRLLDLVAATEHDRFARLDYGRLAQQGICVAREGLRWPLVESRPGHYDFSGALPMVRAARSSGVRVIWDLCHFGWPEHLDLFKPEFAAALADYGAAFAQWLGEETNDPGLFVPINEISFFAWASADEGSMYPFVTGRGFELKAQLVRAAVQAMAAIWAVRPSARFLHVDPLVHVLAAPNRPQDQPAAEAYRLAQYQAWDMLAGRLWPELGGEMKYLDLVGVNYYPQNQWFYDLQGVRRIRPFSPLSRRHRLYRPFRDMLAEVDQRYHRPLFVAETGAENRARTAWLRYVCQEVQAARLSGVPLHGICLYPILNHPGWVDDRHCHNGLWDYPEPDGHREIYKPLAAEIRRWRKTFELSTDPPALQPREADCLPS